jgi:hypothetical protein
VHYFTHNSVLKYIWNFFKCQFSTSYLFAHSTWTPQRMKDLVPNSDMYLLSQVTNSHILT